MMKWGNLSLFANQFQGPASYNFITVLVRNLTNSLVDKFLGLCQEPITYALRYAEKVT